MNRMYWMRKVPIVFWFLPIQIGCETAENGDTFVAVSRLQVADTEVVCVAGNDPAFCHRLGNCNEDGTACECYDPDHFWASEQCTVWHDGPEPQPEQVCSPDNQSYCNRQGVYNADGTRCDCIDSIHFWPTEQSALWKETPAAPVFVYPIDGQTLDYAGSYLFKVEDVPGATGYLWGFFQDGTMIWENYRDEGSLSQSGYGIHPDSDAYSRFAADDTDVWVRALVNGAWTDATVITIHFKVPPAPMFDYPVDGQMLNYTGYYMFRVNPVAQASGYLWGFFQNGEMVWENYRDEGSLSTNQYVISPNTTAYARFLPQEADVWVRAMVHGRWSEAGIITIHFPDPLPMPVLVMGYFPRDHTNPSILDETETGWTNMPVDHMRNATLEMADAGVALNSDATCYHGYADPSAPMSLQFEIIDHLEFFEPMPRGLELNPGEFRPNYNSILSDVNICDYVDNLGVKEVWLYGYHSNFIVPDESKMASRYGDVSNALPKDENISPELRLPTCNNSYVMYNFTYQPGGGNAIGNTIHNRLHQIENVVFFAEDMSYPVNDTRAVGSLFWDDFSVYGNRAALPGYAASCGNTHAPPNVIDADYIYNSLNYRLNNCETWHPDDSLTTYVLENCTQWGCTDVGFYRWFMQSIPGKDNGIVYGGKQMRNWWLAVYDFNRFIDRARSLYEL